MRGSMRQRSPGSWELRVFEGRDPLSGTRRYRSRTVRGDKEAAERALAEMVVVARTAPTSVRDALERWFEDVQRSLRPSTRSTTRVVLDAHVLPQLGQLPLAELTTQRLDDHYRRLGAAGGRGGRRLSAATVRRVHSVVHAALVHAVARGWLADNPATGCSLPTLKPREAAVPSPDQLRALLGRALAQDLRVGALVRLAALIGARRGELLALRWRDIDWGSATVVLGAGGAVGEERPLCLDQATLELLRTHRAQAEEAASACGVALADDGFLFASSPDSRASWPPWAATQAFARLAGSVGHRSLRLDDVRRFAAAQLLEAGADARAVAVRVPSSSAPFLRRGHRPVSHEVDRHAAALLARILDEGAAAGVGTEPEQR